MWTSKNEGSREGKRPLDSLGLSRLNGLSRSIDMRKIDGKVYDTETATEVCDMSPRGIYRGDFKYENTWLPEAR
jgi:hypothetical protein